MEDPASSTVVPVPPSALATQRPLPQASTLSPGPREDWFNLGRAPQDTIARGSLLCNTCLAPVVRTTSDPNRLHSSLSSLSCWWATANAVFFLTLARQLSQQDLPSHHPAVMSQAPQEGMQPQARFPGRGQGQTQGKQGPTTPSAPAPQNSTGVQKKTGSWRSGSPFRKGPRTFQLDQPGNVQQEALERDSRHQPHSSGRTPQQAQGDCDQHAQSDSVGPKTCDSGRHFFMGPGKKRLEKSLREHLGRKTHQGMIPLCMRKSWLAAKHNFYNCNARAKPRELACFKLQMASVNSWQELPFLHPKTRLLLEVQFQRACLKHRWGPLYGPFSP